MSARIWTMIFPLAIVGAGIQAGGCSGKITPPAADERVCVPGNRTFCRCRDFSEGSHECNADGKSFGPCEGCPDEEDLGPPDPDADEPIDVVDPPEDSGVDTSLPPSDTRLDAYDARETAVEAAVDALDTAETVPIVGDKCPGVAVSVDTSKTLELSGDTLLMNSDYLGEGVCNQANATKDAVYEVTPVARGKLTVEMTGKIGFDATLYAREGDCTTGNQKACAETTGSGGTEKLTFNAVAGRPYWVFADGKSGSAGSYYVRFSLVAGDFCGDTVVETNEACDDGNNRDGDGCSAACLPEDIVAGRTDDKCDGLPVHIWDKPVAFNGSTDGYAHDHKAQGCSTAGGGPDRVYAITAHKSGVFTADVSDPTYKTVMYARTTCADTTTELACANQGTGTTNKVSFAVTKDQKFFLFMDGTSTTPNTGKYKLTLSIL